MLILSLSVLISLLCSFGWSAPTKSSKGCGYESCNLGDPSKLNVHIVSHTHDDVGWLKTVDQYYYGARNNIQHAGVQYILDSVMHSLEENPDRRFIYVEMAFFWRWWNQQNDQTREKVRQFVNEGRLEFISAGWCMNDEASTHYNSIIDQHSLGAEFLRDQFGDCARPKIAWQIDPFGHSREQGSIFAQMGFDGLFFGRADYQDYEERNRTKSMELLWKTSANLDTLNSLFTGVLPNGYSPPDSFCFDLFCSDPPIMDDPRLQDYNVPERVQSFIRAAHEQALGYKTNHIIMTMGSDFQYENANQWFKNLDKLIKYVNAEQTNGSNVNVFYSTPSCYLYALNRVDTNWTMKSDDFFPYAHHPHGFWTGYFTSRPALKRYERYSNNILQAVRQLNAVSQSNLRDEIFPLSEAMGLAQHHDAVSGTEKQEVAFDYAMRLAKGIDKAVDVVNKIYGKLLPIENQTISPQFLCQLANISECLPIEKQQRFTLTLWNPTVHTVVDFVRIPVTNFYTIRDKTGRELVADFVPISESTKNIPGRKSFAEHELIFKVILPALGFNTFYFQATDGKPSVSVRENDFCTLENDNLRIEFDADGNLKSIVNLKKKISVSMRQHGFYWYSRQFVVIGPSKYLGFPGNNSESEFQASGAYIFRPISPEALPLAQTRSITCLKGQVVQTARISYNNWIHEEIHLYDGSRAAEILWTVGPIPIDDGVGKEIVLRYDTDIESNSRFYTDANGREVLERIRDFRPTWNYSKVETVSGNYYPVNSRIWIKDVQRQLTILTDRSQGGSSILDGSIELMLHRRTLYDDALGVGEPLNETAFGQGLVVRGRHLLLLDTPSSSAVNHRILSQEFFMKPLATFALTSMSYDEYSSNFHQWWSSLANDLPANVHLLTLDQLNNKEFLVRLEHFFERNEDENYSQSLIIDLQKLFDRMGTISEIVELNLSANIPKNEINRLVWKNIEGKTNGESQQSSSRSIKATNIRLNPMEIRTFRIVLD